MYPIIVQVPHDGTHFIFNNLASFGSTQTVEQTQDQRTERQAEVTQELLQEVNNQQNQLVQEDLNRTTGPQLTLDRTAWEANKDYFSSTRWIRTSFKRKPRMNVFQVVESSLKDLFLSQNKVETYSPNQIAFFGLKAMVAKANNPAIAAISKAFSNRSWCTENFIGQTADFLGKSLVSPFGHKQRPLLHLLVTESRTRNGKIVQRVGALEQHEASLWRERLQQNQTSRLQTAVKIAMFDPVLNAVTLLGSHSLETQSILNDPKAMRQVMNWKFLSGNVNYTAAEVKLLESWIKKNNIEKMRKAFMAIHALHGSHVYEGSSIEHVFVHLMLAQSE